VEAQAPRLSRSSLHVILSYSRSNAEGAMYWQLGNRNFARLRWSSVRSALKGCAFAAGLLRAIST
jgi:hypothetical protein